MLDLVKKTHDYVYRDYQHGSSTQLSNFLPSWRTWSLQGWGFCWRSMSICAATIISFSLLFWTLWWRTQFRATNFWDTLLWPRFCVGAQSGSVVSFRCAGRPEVTYNKVVFKNKKTMTSTCRIMINEHMLGWLRQFKLGWIMLNLVRLVHLQRYIFGVYALSQILVYLTKFFYDNRDLSMTYFFNLPYISYFWAKNFSHII